MPKFEVQYVERYTESLDWITLLLVGCLLLFTIAKSSYPKRFQEFIMLPLNNKYFLVHGKNDEINHPFNVLLFISQVISVSLFVFLFFRIKNPEIQTTNPWLFIQICTGYTFFVLVKSLIEKMVGTIFSMDILINNYLYQKLSYRNILAMVLFISNLIFFYAVRPSLSFLMFFMFFIFALNCISLYNSYKTFGNLILRNFFYFILYLCALEIAPYIILYKALQ